MAHRKSYRTIHPTGSYEPGPQVIIQTGDAELHGFEIPKLCSKREIVLLMRRSADRVSPEDETGDRFPRGGRLHERYIAIDRAKIRSYNTLS